MSKNSSTKEIISFENLKKELTHTGELPFHFKKKVFSEKITKWYQENQRPLPWRKIFKKTKDPYHVWVSEIMLQQTVIAAVIPKYLSFIEKYPSAESLAKASEAEIQKSVAGLGYYRRFRMMHEASKEVSKSRNFPQTYKEIKELKGIGEYTASAISSICFGEAEAVVDGNVERVMCRVFDLRLPPNLPALKKVFKKSLNTLICHESPGDFNQGIMELGQLICTPTNPSCDRCPIKNSCKANKNKTTDLAPGKKIKKDFVELTTHVFIYKKNNRILLVNRSANSKFLPGLEGFEISLSENKKLKPSSTFKHTITNHKLTNKVYLVSAPKNFSSKGRWVELENCDAEITTSFDKKAFNSIKKSIFI